MSNLTKKAINFKVLFYKIGLIIFGTAIYSIGLKWFIYSAKILPGGFTGLSVLLQELVYNSTKIQIPITVYNVSFNIFPAILSYKYVGKKFTIISFIILFLFNFIADNIPIVQLNDDPLISAIFGGILCGIGASFWFRSGASGGGTDFIAMTVSTLYHKTIFGFVMAFNILLIIIQGFLFGWSSAFHSIIYQYCCTQAITLGYRHYEARTIFIITTKADELSKALIEGTGHSTTKFNGIGCYSHNAKSMLYTVVTQPEVRYIIHIAKECDPNAFINVMKSNEVQGNFKYLAVDKDEIDLNAYI